MARPQKEEGDIIMCRKNKKSQDKSEKRHSHLLLTCLRALDFSDLIILPIFLFAAIMVITFAVKV